MCKLIVPLNEKVVANQIASFLNKYNNLKTTLTPDGILHSSVTYLVELGNVSDLEIDGSRKIVAVLGIQHTSREAVLLKHLCVHEDFRRKGLAIKLILQGMKTDVPKFFFATVRSDNMASLQILDCLKFMYISHEKKDGYFILTLGRKVCGSEPY